MLSGIELANLLRQCSLDVIHHANTVATALTYLRQRGLLSRQCVEKNPQNCFQTLQSTDNQDKALGIFNDIFFDVENLWEKHDICFYGPVVLSTVQTCLNFLIMFMSAKQIQCIGIPVLSTSILSHQLKS